MKVYRVTHAGGVQADWAAESPDEAARQSLRDCKLAVMRVEEAGRVAATPCFTPPSYRVTFFEEKILGGIRYSPGVYSIVRVGDIDQGEKLEF